MPFAIDEKNKRDYFFEKSIPGLIEVLGRLGELYPEIRPAKDAAEKYFALKDGGGNSVERRANAVLFFELSYYLKYGNFSSSIKDEIDNLISIVVGRREQLVEPVPKKLHFVWLGKLDPIQCDYIRIWLRNIEDPEYEVTLWSDDEAHLARELFQRLRRAANAEVHNVIASGSAAFDDALADAIIRWQNKAHASISEAMKGKKSFDEAAIAFLVKEGFGTQNELENIRKNNHESFKSALDSFIKENSKIKIDLKWFKDVEDHPSVPVKKYGQQELTLRQSYAAFSDIYRYLILRSEGGWYLDADLLPVPCDDLLEKELPNGSRLPGYKPDGEIARRNADGTMEPDIESEQMMQAILDAEDGIPERSERRGRGIYLDILSYGDQSVVNEMTDAVRAVKASGKSRFSPVRQMYDESPWGIMCRPGNNNNSLVAVPRGDALEQILANIDHNYKFMRTHNIDGLDKGNLRPDSGTKEMRSDFARENPFVPADALLDYRLDTIRSSARSTIATSGPSVVQSSQYQLLKKWLGVDVNQFDLKRLPILDPFPKSLGAAILTEEDRLSTWMKDAIMTGEEIYDRQSEYEHHVLVQLSGDSIANETARFLFNKHADRTTWMHYDPLLKSLTMDPRSAQPGLHGRSRLTLLGHADGSDSTLGGMHVERIAELVRGVWPNATPIERVSVVGCQVLESLPGDRGTLPEGLARSLYEALERNKLVVRSLSTREGLVTVDVFGHKWVGELPQGGQEVQWNPAKGSGKKFIIARQTQNAPLTYTRVPIEAGELKPRQIISSFPAGRFDVGNVMDAPTQSVPLKHEYLSSELAKHVLEAAGGSNVMLPAGPAALLAGMSPDLPYEVVVCDLHRARLAAMQQSLLLAVDSKSYEEWLRKLANYYDTTQLKSVIGEHLGPKIADAFRLLQDRIRENKFAFYNVNLADETAAQRIRLGLTSSDAPMCAFVRLDPYLALPDAQVRGALQGVQATLKRLMGSVATHLGFYSELDTSWYWPVAKPDDAPLLHHFDEDPERFKALVLGEAEQAHHVLLAETVATMEQLASGQRALLSANKLEPQKWVPLLGGMEYDAVKKVYKVPVASVDNPKVVKTLETSDRTLQEVRQYLDTQASALQRDFEYRGEQLRPKLGMSATERASIATNTLFALMAAKQWIENGVAVEGSDALSKTLQVHTYVAIVQTAHGLASDAATLTSLATKALTSEIEAAAAGGRGVLTTLWRGSMRLAGEGAGMVMGAASVVLDAIELSQAQNEVQRGMFATQLAFDSAGLALGIAGLIAGWVGAAALSAWLPGIGILLAVAGYFVGKWVSDLLQAATNARQAGIYFNKLRTAWENGGFSVIKQVLAPIEGAVITEIRLDSGTPSVVFDGPQIRKMRDRTQTLDGYLDLRALYGLEATRTIMPATRAKLNTMVLPGVPKVKLTPSYSFLPFVHARGDSEFETARLLQRKEPTFVFDNPGSDYVMTALDFQYEKTTVSVYLGEQSWNLVAPGLREDDLQAESICQKYLNYQVRGAKGGNAVHTLVLSKAQGDIIIDSNSNAKTTWFIDAGSLLGVGLGLDGTRGLVFERFVSLPEGKSAKEQIRVNIANPATTTLRVRLPVEGIIQVDLNQRRLIPFETDVKALIESGQGNSDTNIVRYIEQQVAGLENAVEYLRVDNYRALTTNETLDRCFYAPKVQQFWYTTGRKNFFEGFTRSNTELLCTRSEWVWYRGDLQQKVDDTVHTYAQVIWVGHKSSKALHMVHVPLGHLPTITRDEQTLYKSPSKVMETQVYGDAIFVKQHLLSDQNKSLYLTYLVPVSESPGDYSAITEFEGGTGTLVNQIKE